MSTPDKLLEPDRHHWMAFPLDRPPGGTALLEPEADAAPRAPERGPARGDAPAPDSHAPEGTKTAPPVRERVFNPELKQATQKVLEHPVEPSRAPASERGVSDHAAAAGGLAAAGMAVAVAAGAKAPVHERVVERPPTSGEDSTLDDSEFEAMLHDEDHDEAVVLDVDDDELSIDDDMEEHVAESPAAPEALDQAMDEHSGDEHSLGEQTKDRESAPDVAATETMDEDLEPPRPADLDWLRPVPPPMPVEIVESLYHLFGREDVQNQDFMAIMEYIRTESKADALAGMLFDPIDFVYRLYLHDKIDICTRKNIFFALNDEYLDSDSPISVLRFADFKGDFFFSKRFSTDFFKSMQGAVLLNLNVYELPGYFMLFYRDLSARDDDVLRALSESIIRDLVPLVQRLRRVNGLVHYRTTLEDSRDNYTLRLYQLLKELSHSGKDPIRVIHVNFRALEEGGAIRPYLIQICEKLRKVLGPRERVAILPPGRLSVLLKSDEVDAVLEVVKTISTEANLEPDWQVMRYPESGRNLLNYLR